MSTDDIRTRLLKVLRLAHEGVGGERENAAVLLEKLLRKHDMTMADLEGVNEQAATRVWLSALDSDGSIVALLSPRRGMRSCSGSVSSTRSSRPGAERRLTCRQRIEPVPSVRSRWPRRCRW